MYLIPKDYQVNIQDANIQQILGSDETIRVKAQLAGEAEAKSYLKQKYDISREFQNLDVWAYDKIYYGFNRFYLYAAAYNPALTYNNGDLCAYNGNVYIATDTGITGAFDPNLWDLVGKLYDIYSVKTPYPEFNYSALYNIGDHVFWNNKTYTCRVQTPILDHDTGLQYRTIQNLPLPNVAPDDPQNGIQYWGVGTSYSVTGQPPANETYFEHADNRDAQMVLYLCDIVLYHLHTRIAPRNIPDLRVKRYDDAIEWLRMCAEGKVTPNLPLLKPMQGNRIRFGSNIRQINTY